MPLDMKIAQLRQVFADVALQGVGRLADVRPELDRNVLLHAGPPFENSTLPNPIRNAAIHALVYAGWDGARAAEALNEGMIRLEPAQDHGVVTPLAQVVSSAMPVFRVGDSAHEILAPIAEAVPPALRFGSADTACIEHMRRHGAWASAELAPRLADERLSLVDWIEAALIAGEECHARTGAANAELLSTLGKISPPYREAIRSNANFVLPVLMAGSAWAILTRGSSISAVGGNGETFGVRFAGESAWRTTPAAPPTGVRVDDGASLLLGAVGDSPVVDFCGLGGQAIGYASALVDDWGALLPADWAQRADAVIEPSTGMVCRHRITLSGVSPLVHLAMVDASPSGGLAGRGFYEPNSDLFKV